MPVNLTLLSMGGCMYALYAYCGYYRLVHLPAISPAARDANTAETVVCLAAMMPTGDYVLLLLMVTVRSISRVVCPAWTLFPRLSVLSGAVFDVTLPGLAISTSVTSRHLETVTCQHKRRKRSNS
nr:hypothetical protein L203_00438 [Cryptococcus depauperatus CBS 7841]